MTEYRKDEYKKVQIPFGFNEKLQKVDLSLFHSFFVAMTGHGKTLGMKSLLQRFHARFPDWRILIIDSKDKRDYADLHADIPICFVETTDPLDLKNLLEPIVSAKMMYYFDKIIEEATFDTLGEMQRNIERKIIEADKGRLKIPSKELGKLRVINFTLRKLVDLIEKPNIIKELKLHDGFNVMPVSLPDVKNPNLKRAFQQLIVRSALLLLLADPNYERTLLVLDENHKWNPQRYASICKQPLGEFISEGRSQDKIVWLADQALTKIDKEALKNVKVWVVGQQMESNEVQDARDTVNDITTLSVSEGDVKTLKTGFWILVDGLHQATERAYLQPTNVPDNIAVEIVKTGNPDLAEPYIREYEMKALKGEENMETEQIFNKIEAMRTELKARVDKLDSDFKKIPSIGDIVSRVLQKLPTSSVNKEEIVEELAKRIPKITGAVTYEVAPLEKLQRDFQEAAKAQVIQEVNSLNPEQKKILKFIEALQKGTSISETMAKCLFINPSSGGSRDRVNEEVNQMVATGLVKKDAGGKLFPNLKTRLATLMQPHEATEQEIEAVYNHTLVELLA